MPKILTWENGQKVIRWAVPGDGAAYDPDEAAERAAQEFIDQDRKIRALAAVVADVIVAAGLETDIAVARQRVRNRFKHYFKAG